MTRSILITGGAGFVGSSIGLALRARYPGAVITALDSLYRKGSEKNLPRLAGAGIRFVKGDVRKPRDLASVGRCTLVIDCAAEPSVLVGAADGAARYAIETNLMGTVNCLELAREEAASLLFVSTSRVYPYTRLQKHPFEVGEKGFVLAESADVPGISKLGVSEDFPLDGARTLYGAGKLASELIIREYAELYGVKAIVFRCGLLAGPWQFGRTDQGVVALWVARHLFGGELTTIGFGGKGDQVRDVLHIADFVRLVLHAVEKFDSLAGRTFNVGGGPANAVSLRTLTALCREATGKTLSIGSDPQTRPGDIPWYITDNRNVSEATGWIPQRTVADTVQDIASWLSVHRGQVEGIFSP